MVIEPVSPQPLRGSRPNFGRIRGVSPLPETRSTARCVADDFPAAKRGRARESRERPRVLLLALRSYINITSQFGARTLGTPPGHQPQLAIPRPRKVRIPLGRTTLSAPPLVPGPELQ